MKIEYCGPCFDPSGYGNFSKNFILALHKEGHDLTVWPHSFDTQRPDLGEERKIIESLVPKNREKADVCILNMTPEFFPHLKGTSKINIGFTMFETNRIPKIWVEECNKMDAIFVPCQWNVDVFRESGVKVPLYNIPHGLYKEDFIDKEPTNTINGSENNYLFYSIFQWTPRKNPEGLLRAYWSEFTGNDKVALILKTYGTNTSINEQNRIKGLIKEIKASINLEHFPKVLFVGNLLSIEQIRDLRLNSDCFVLPHRAEGFGMPHMEAMANGNPAISTNFSGNLEFMNQNNSYLVNSQMTPVHSMPWCKWYEGDMLWGEPDLQDLRKKMRYVYENQDKAKRMGKKGQKYLFENFNWSKRIQHMVKCIEEVVDKK